MSCKRWVWEESARRKGADPTRWLIDNEYHVQSVLWAVLYPIFGLAISSRIISTVASRSGNRPVIRALLTVPTPPEGPPPA